jgi:hypothetical protein
MHPSLHISHKYLTGSGTLSQKTVAVLPGLASPAVVLFQKLLSCSLVSWIAIDQLQIKVIATQMKQAKRNIG